MTHTLVSLRKDYYNDITAEEIESLYSVKKAMQKAAWNDIITNTVFILPMIIFLGIFMYDIANEYGWKYLFFSQLSDSTGLFVLFIFALIEVIAMNITELCRWRDFFFGKGKIISLESEYFEGNKKRPEGYYRHTLTIAVSETEAVGNIYYFSDKEWDKNLYIGKDAIAVYFPKAHLLYAVIDGENAENYTGEFSDLIFKKERKKRK